MKDVAAEMAKADVKGIHLALGPFIAPDERHGAAEGAQALALVKEKIAKGEWVLMSTMVGTVGEDYSTLETIRKTGGIVPDAAWEANKVLVKKAVALTKELGARYMTLHAGFLDESNPAAIEKYRARVQWIADACAAAGVKLLLESGQETAVDLAKFMPMVKNVGINFDPANMILYGKGNPVEAVKLLAPWIEHVHVKDAKKTSVPGTWGSEVPWGDGEANPAALLAALQAAGYKGAFAIEREAGTDRPGDIALAVKRFMGDFK